MELERKKELALKYDFTQSRLWENKAGYEIISPKQVYYINKLINADKNAMRVYTDIIELFMLLELPSHIASLIKSQAMFLINRINEKMESA